MSGSASGRSARRRATACIAVGGVCGAYAVIGLVPDPRRGLEPPRGAADRGRPGGRQHRRLRVRQPGQARHGHVRSPTGSRSRSPTAGRTSTRSPTDAALQHQRRQRRRRAGRTSSTAGRSHNDRPARQRHVPVQQRPGHLARRREPAVPPDATPWTSAPTASTVRRRRISERPGRPVATSARRIDAQDYAEPARPGRSPARRAAGRPSPARPTTRSSSTCASSTCCTAATCREVGQDTLAGYNVNTIALQVPKSDVALERRRRSATRSSASGSTTDRGRRPAHRRTGHRRAAPDRPGVPAGQPAGQRGRRAGRAEGRVQRDQPPTRTPRAAAVVDRVTDPEVPQLIQGIYGIPAPPPPRNDLVEIFLTGIATPDVDGGDAARSRPTSTRRAQQRRRQRATASGRRRCCG